MKHPMQPVVIDDSGSPRFLSNPIVRFLLDSSTARGVGLNELVGREEFSEDDWSQFAQLIGYSVGGYCELDYVSKAKQDRAVELAKKAGFPWQQGTEAVKKWKQENGYPVD